jgi:hypothetical protein
LRCEISPAQVDIVSGKLGNIADWIEDGAGD